MKPGDHPEFFRFPAPEGRSRESSIVLDAAGRFWHDGERIEHPGMAKAFARWMARHPDDGRYILTNDYDWTYLTVEDTPYFVSRVNLGGQSGSSAAVVEATLQLSDGTEEPLRLAALREGPDGSLYTWVKQGAFEARFTPAAQLDLAPLVVEEGEQVLLALGDERVLPPPRERDARSPLGALESVVLEPGGAPRD
ncbi:MAG: DUF1285 domain-containing protein [Polyangiaceae bacterium]|nr:DUF1285 domain-containing protein [Polyangiaceae bacterium]